MDGVALALYNNVDMEWNILLYLYFSNTVFEVNQIKYRTDHKRAVLV